MPNDMPYAPRLCGTVHQAGKINVYGLAYDPSNDLVALSLHGPATLIESLHFSIQGQTYNFTLSPLDSDYTGFHRRCKSVNYHYKVLKKAIPDTNDLSMIMMNESLFSVIPDRDFCHVHYRNEEDFKREVFLRVQEIVYVAVKKEWSTYLLTAGRGVETRSRRALCGRLSNVKESSSWMCAGFDIGYISTSRQAWEQLISEGLKRGYISSSSQNSSEEEVEVPKIATLIEQNGNERTIVPANGTDFKLAELYGSIGCEMVEVVNLSDGRIMIIDEEGKFNSEKSTNATATKLFLEGRIHAGDVIVGNVIVCPSSMLR